MSHNGGNGSCVYLHIETLAVRALDANEDSAPGGDVLAFLKWTVPVVVVLERDTVQAFLHDGEYAVDDGVLLPGSAEGRNSGEIHLEAHSQVDMW